MMPLVDGFEVCKLLKDHPTTRLIPVVMMTALDSVEDRIKGIDAGADDFLTKPVHRDELLARIRTSLRLKQVIDATLDRRRQETPQQPPEVADTIFRQEGDYWTLAYHGTVCRLKDLKGLHYLAFLLAHPGEACPAVALVSAVDHPQTPPAAPAYQALSADQLAVQHLRVGGLGDAGAVLDAQAQAAYKRRIEELQADLAEAQRWQDLGRATTAQAEIEFLTAELAAALGLGGRDRRVASSTERARLMVTKAIKAALDKIHANHPTLGHHLATSITTGTYCTYSHDPATPLSWRL
jgi:non-specific serine/threonine protein kinase